MALTPSMLVTLAWRNLWRQPRRTGLTAGAITFSAAISVFVLSMNLGIIHTLIDYNLRLFTGHVQLQHPDYLERKQIFKTVDHAASLAARLRHELSMDRVAVRAGTFALLSSTKRTVGVRIVGVQPEFEPRVSTLPGLVTEGRYLNTQDTEKAVIGTALAHNLGVKPGDELTVLGSGEDGSFAATVLHVAGIFDGGSMEINRYMTFIPLRTFQQTFNMGDKANSIVLRGDHPGDTNKLVARLAPHLPAGQAIAIRDWNALQPGLRQLIAARLTMIWFLFSLLLLIVAFSVFNTLLMSVLERTREFGIMQAIGLKPFRITRLVMLESAMLAITGVVAGILIGGTFTAVVQLNGVHFDFMEGLARQFNLPTRLYPELTWLSVSLGPGVVLVTTTLTALYPAIKVRSLDPVLAMQRT